MTWTSSVRRRYRRSGASDSAPLGSSPRGVQFPLARRHSLKHGYPRSALSTTYTYCTNTPILSWQLLSTTHTIGTVFGTLHCSRALHYQVYFCCRLEVRISGCCRTHFASMMNVVVGKLALVLFQAATPNVPFIFGVFLRWMMVCSCTCTCTIHAFSRPLLGPPRSFVVWRLDAVWHRPLMSADINCSKNGAGQAERF